ncbi:MAG: hypothetical protein V1902_03700 [Candidatus Falkowbacteria bacterium]
MEIQQGGAVMATGIWLAVIVVLALGAIVLGCKVANADRVRRGRRVQQFIALGFMVCCLLTVALLFAPLVVEFNGEGWQSDSWQSDIGRATNPFAARLATLDEQGKVVDVNVPLAWNYDNCVNYTASPKPISTVVKPITENPKVREVHYTVAFEEVDVKKFVEAVVAMAPYDGQMSHEQFEARYLRLVKLVVYDFNDAHSKELSEFYNPLRTEQQAAFLDLLKKYLDPKLAEVGLAVKAVTWDVL